MAFVISSPFLQILVTSFPIRTERLGIFQYLSLNKYIVPQVLFLAI